MEQNEKVIYYGNPKCGPCKVFKPYVQKVFGDNFEEVIITGPLSQNDIAKKYNIKSIPFLIVYGEVITRDKLYKYLFKRINEMNS